MCTNIAEINSVTSRENDLYPNKVVINYKINKFYWDACVAPLNICNSGFTMLVPHV